MPPTAADEIEVSADPVLGAVVLGVVRDEQAGVDAIVIVNSVRCLRERARAAQPEKRLLAEYQSSQQPQLRSQPQSCSSGSHGAACAEASDARDAERERREHENNSAAKSLDQYCSVTITWSE